ncbi:MAG: HAD-IIB family hydrolase [Nitrosomonadales bacterium]|nr:HAD-IIB family hydrolase [Nitrosomonadales bacterium]
MNRFLLCTDLDRTLIPNGVQPESAGAIERLKRLVSREEVALAYVSGRNLSLIEQAIAEFSLPRPDFAIADVGATIYRAISSGWQQSDAWDAQLAPDWKGLTHGGICFLLGDLPMLQLQENEKQGRHKLSFYVPLETDTQKLASEMGKLLKQVKISANLIWSIDEKAGIGLLDILPASAGKLHAIRFLMQLEGFSRENTIFAGDSGNDLDVLLSDIPAVLVANAGPEVRSLVSNADTDTLYVASGGYLGMNGNYSAGILEGVAHYWPEANAWLCGMNEMNELKGC